MNYETNRLCACANYPIDMFPEAAVATLWPRMLTRGQLGRSSWTAVITKNFRPLAGRMRVMWGGIKKIAPYAALELLLPGGTVVAILVWLYRRRRAALGAMAPQVSILH